MPRRKRFFHPDDPMTRVAWLMLVVCLAELALALWILGAIRPLS
jgi:hypothetical protein